MARGRLPAHRHADGQPAARPVQPAQGGPPPAGEQLLQLRQALLRRLRQRLRARHQRRLERRGAGDDRLRRDAAPHEVRGARPPAEDALVAAGRGGRQARSGSEEARALDYLERNPARSGRRGRTFLGMLNQARHALAVAKVPRPLEFVTDCVEPARRSSCSRRTPQSSRRCADARRRCVTLTGTTTPTAARDGGGRRFQNDDRAGLRSATSTPPASASPDRRHPRRVQRPRLGAGQPLAGRGPHLPHRPDSSRRSSPTSSPRARSTTSSPRCSSRRRARSACSRTRPPTGRRCSTRSSSRHSAARRLVPPRRVASRATEASASSATSSTCSRGCRLDHFGLGR